MKAASFEAGRERAQRPPALLDVARGIAMVIVLYGHALEVLFLERPDGVFLQSAFLQYKVMASFAMALFFVLSGASAARLAAKGWRSVLRTSIYLLALAYLVHLVGLVVMLAETVLAGGSVLADWLPRAVDSTLRGRYFSTIVIWFLVSLAFVRLIVFGLLAMLPERRAHWAALGLGLAGCLLTPAMPDLFALRSWPAGVLFFTLGLVLAGRLGSLRWIAGLAMVPLLIWTALANQGCLFDPARLCVSAGLPGEAVVWLHIGAIGFLPFFLAAALLGSVVVIAVAHAVLLVAARVPAPARLLASIGKRTLELLIINGFVLVFLQPQLKAVPVDAAGLWLYPPLLVAVVSCHLLLLKGLAGPLGALQRLAFLISDAGIALLAARAPAVRRETHMVS